MKADYDSKADALSIDLIEASRWEDSEEVEPRLNVAIANQMPVNIELLYPGLGVEKPLQVVAARYGLDAEALVAAARAAIAVPDRTVTLDVSVRAVA
ncbi:MAG TPA: DUF2283 domain-containing protein [Solirubrobacterales bacterium]|nr:DUF2283 domain-containing protein [Solirubrobacterales bacterium]